MALAPGTSTKAGCDFANARRIVCCVTVLGRASFADSVANGYGQTHEIENLWLAGVTLFPTEGAVNPSYTLYAVSLRAAEYLAASWASVVH